MKKSYDVIIIGGGPAGSTLGSYLAKEDISCAIFEKEKFPRPHVGEALVPSSTEIFNDLGLIKKLEKQHFPKKYGAIWTSEKNDNIYSHDWDDVEDSYKMEVEFRPDDDYEFQNYTYHVRRDIFDKILLDNAKEIGADIFEEHQVFSTDINDKGVNINVRNSEKEEFKIWGKIIVDASGRNTLLGNKFKWKIKDPVFNQCAVHCWFKNYERTNVEERYTAIHFLPIANSWIWQIPINNDTTSIGIISQKEDFAKEREDIKSFFWTRISSRPDLYERLKKAEQLNDFKIEGDYSYAMKNVVGNRCLLIGDAARFVDPIFSSGVSIALQSAKFASRDIINALKTDKFDKSQFKNYQTLIERGCKNWYRFISLYYRLNVTFTYFLSKSEYHRDVLKFLQGDVYDEDDPEFLDAMTKFVEGVEQNPKHPLHDYLGNLTANKFNPNTNYGVE